jgi:class 3 adenylate cyclase
MQDESGEWKPMSQDLVGWLKSRNSDTLQSSLAFVPWIVQDAIFKGEHLNDNIVLHRGAGAVVYCHACGFTALTERLEEISNGTKLMAECLDAFFTPLIDLIDAYRGDIIKFRGDGLVVYFPAVDDTLQNDPVQAQETIPAHGSYDQPDMHPTSISVLRAAACCIEIHKRLHMFDTGTDGLRLCLRIGVGYGEVAVMSVGSIAPPQTHVPRSDLIICGEPLEQISIAERLAKIGETCLSPQAWEHIRDCVEGAPLEDRPDYHLLFGLDEAKFTFPTIKYTAMETDTRNESRCGLSEMNMIRTYIPTPVFLRIQGGTLPYINEMRHITTVFLIVSGVDVSSHKDVSVAQKIAAAIQTACYAHEGTLNKVIADVNGMVFLLVYGLPPMVHTDDSTRAVLSCLDMVHVLRRMNLVGTFGITTGRAFCGICGSAKRMEYTVLGENVNLAAEMMFHAPEKGVFCDDETMKQSTGEVTYMELAPIKVKGKMLTIYQPSLSPPPQVVGLNSDGSILFPWHERLCGETRSVRSDKRREERVKRSNVAQICSLEGWHGIIQVQSILGEDSSIESLTAETLCPRGMERNCQSISEGTPFEVGGIIVLEGRTGGGKFELAEHIITFTAVRLGILPIFGSMGPRLGDQERFGVELLRSTLGVFRHLDATLPGDDLPCLVRVLPPEHSSLIRFVKEAMAPQGERETSSQELLDELLGLVKVLLDIVRRQTSVLVVLELEIGTNMFSKTLNGFSGFWHAVHKLYEVAAPEAPCGQPSECKPVSILVLSKVVPKHHKSVKAAIKRGWHVKTDGLSEESSIEYIAKYLGVPEQEVPQPLQRFVFEITTGNPLFIRETLDELILHGYIKFRNTCVAESIQYCHDLESINIASWSHTAMVGETFCLLESLDPLEGTVVKMSSVFTSNFTISDLSSSIVSRWAGATFFDQMRLFRAVRRLVDRGILQEVELDDCDEFAPPTYQLSTLLLQKVGGSMLHEAYRQAVKRQALMNRVLERDLPQRMAEVKLANLHAHVPWYYENILCRSR